MAKPKHPAVELSEKLVQTLHARRGLGPDAYPVPLPQLLALADGQAPAEVVQAAPGRKPFKDQAVIAVKHDAASPVLLAEDAERFAAEPRLLERVLRSVSTPKSWSWPIPKLAGKLHARLQGPFTEAITRHIEAGTLPETIGFEKTPDGDVVYLKELKPVPSPEVALADKMLRVLEAQRSRGDEAYPCSLRHLMELTDPQATPERVAQAVAVKPFQKRVLLARKGHPDTPLALVEDIAVLAASPRLLEFVLGLVSTPQKWSVPVNKLTGPLDRRLKQPFAEAVRRHLEMQTLPETVGSRKVQGKDHLYLKAYQPEPTLAEKLLVRLAAVPAHDPAYPVTLGQLARLLEPPPDAAAMLAAVAEKAFQQQAVVALPGNLEAPVARSADGDRLAQDPRVLEMALLATRSLLNQAVSLSTVKGKVNKAIRQPFVDAVNAQVENGTLPPTVGCLRVNRKPLLFLMRDVLGDRTAPASFPVTEPSAVERAPALAPDDFARAFTEVFDRLDRDRGGHNFVSLVDLRQALPCDRATFDAGLHQLRAAQRFTLSAAEGRHGIRPEEHQAGIREDGALLLFVSRRAP